MRDLPTGVENITRRWESYELGVSASPPLERHPQLSPSTESRNALAAQTSKRQKDRTRLMSTGFNLTQHHVDVRCRKLVPRRIQNGTKLGIDASRVAFSPRAHRLSLPPLHSHLLARHDPPNLMDFFLSRGSCRHLVMSTSPIDAMRHKPFPMWRCRIGGALAPLIQSARPTKGRSHGGWRSHRTPQSSPARYLGIFV